MWSMAGGKRTCHHHHYWEFESLHGQKLACITQDATMPSRVSSIWEAQVEMVGLDDHQ
jgi:hypothetical protein